MEKEKLSVKRIAVAGVLSAVAVILGITPLGYIPWFSGVSITIMHIPVIIAAILEGPVVGALVGLIFGVTSLVRAAVAPMTVLDPYFTNPLVSVIPRILVGLITYLVYRSLRKWEIPALIAASAMGSFINSILVVGALGLFARINWEEIFGAGFWPLFGTIIISNGVPEAIAAAVITFAVVTAWKRIGIGRKGSSLDSLEENE